MFSWALELEVWAFAAGNWSYTHQLFLLCRNQSGGGPENTDLCVQRLGTEPLTGNNLLLLGTIAVQTCCLCACTYTN